jgi:hypothetical protein
MIEEKSKRIKKYEDHQFNVKIKGLEKEIEIFKEMKRLIKVIDENANSVPELEHNLNKKSGFINAELSALAYNFKNEFERVKVLESNCKNVKDEYLTKDFKLKKIYINEVRDKFITYFSDEELQARKTLEKLMETFNELPPNYRYLIGYNRKYELAYTNQGEYKVNKSAEKILEKELIKQ